MKKDITAETQRTQSKILFPLAIEGMAKGNQCFSSKILFVFRPLSEKQKLVVLCVLGVSAVKIRLENLITPIY